MTPSQINLNSPYIDLISQDPSPLLSNVDILAYQNLRNNYKQQSLFKRDKFSVIAENEMEYIESKNSIQCYDSLNTDKDTFFKSDN